MTRRERDRPLSDDKLEPAALDEELATETFAWSRTTMRTRVRRVVERRLRGRTLEQDVEAAFGERDRSADG